MKKNGFIATSLIYSFFLIFITLFLTIIVDYIDTKGKLDYQESTVKKNLNRVLGVKDFEPGDYVVFLKDSSSKCSTSTPAPGFNLEYVVANMYIKNSSACGTDIYGNPNDCVVLYGLDLNSSSTSSDVILTDIQRDITSNMNQLTINKILYTFNGTDTSYRLASNAFPTLDSGCTGSVSYLTNKGCVKNSGTSKYRRKKILTFNTSTPKLKSCDGSSKGTYFLELTL